MKYLLDTHAYLWAINEMPRLSPQVQGAIESGDNELFLSLGSLWEIAIKLSIGKLALDTTFIELSTELPASYAVETYQSLSATSRLSPACRFITAIRSTCSWSPSALPRD
jgi:PIN domain nuclease of toxin-antitoxin system